MAVLRRKNGCGYTINGELSGARLSASISYQPTRFPRSPTEPKRQSAGFDLSSLPCECFVGQWWESIPVLLDIVHPDEPLLTSIVNLLLTKMHHCWPASIIIRNNEPENLHDSQNNPNYAWPSIIIHHHQDCPPLFTTINHRIIVIFSTIKQYLCAYTYIYIYINPHCISHH